MKTFDQYLIERMLMSDVISRPYEIEGTNKQIEKIISKKYERIYFNDLLMLDVVDEHFNENLEDFVLKVSSNQWESDPKKFYDSFMKSDKIGVLTPYSIKDLEDFSLFKAKDYNIGFAIKKDGDIILVHNNEPKIKNIGNFLLKQAIKKGGNKLDHFDGYLTGFYKSNGFIFNSNDEFMDEYVPEAWEYKKVDIDNPKFSIYANELKVDILKFNLAKERYLSGKPDVVYRKFNINV